MNAMRYRLGFLLALPAFLAAAEGDAFLALLDQGKTAEAVELLKDPKACAALQVRKDLQARKKALGPLKDAVLLREGPPDSATRFVLGLYRLGLPGSIPREKEARLLLSWVRMKPGPGDPTPFLALQALSTLRAPETLPDLEKLFLEGDSPVRWQLPDAVAGVGGPDSVASIGRMLEASSQPGDRDNLLESLAKFPSREADALLLELRSSLSDPRDHGQILRILASRPGRLAETSGLLGDPGLPPEDLRMLLTGLAKGAQEDPPMHAALWALYDKSPGLQGRILADGLGFQDPKAKEILLERLRSGSLTDGMTGYLGTLDAKALKENAGPLKKLASGAGTPAARGMALQALSKADPKGAAEAFLEGFPGLGEDDRVAALAYLHWVGTPEAKEGLRKISTQDPSPKVKDAALKLLK